MEKLDGVGVAFCGGGYKSYAEVAALEDMEKNDVKIAACAGTSAGSVLATLCAAGLSASQIYDVLIKSDKRITESGTFKNMKYRIFGLMTSSGFVGWETMLELAQACLQDAGISGFSDIKMPLAIPSVDLLNGELVVFTNEPDCFKDPENRWKTLSGDLDLAHCLVASSAYPLAISPARYLDHYFIDGGCRMNLPTPLFNRDLIDAVVGIGMMRPMKHLSPEDLGTLTILSRTVSCGSSQLDLIHAQLADLYVNIPVSGAEAFDEGCGEGIIQEARIILSSNPVDWSQVKPQVPVENKNSSLRERIASWFRISS